MTHGVPVLEDLVLVGGGHSHVGVIRSFGMEPMPGVRVTVISRDVHAPYSGMLPGLIAGHYGFDEAHIDLRPLTRFARARFLHDEVIGIDTAHKTVSCRARPPIPYDVLSINIGSTPGLEVPGAAGAVVPVKPIDGFWRRWEELRDRCLDRREETHIGVVGAGAGGVELLLAVQYRLGALLAAQGRSAAHLHFHLVSATNDILPSHNHRVRDKFTRALDERGVRVHAGSAVTRVIGPVRTVSPGDASSPSDDRRAPETVSSSSSQGPSYRLELEGDGHLDVDEVLWVTTARAAAWPGASGLDVDERGFIEVRDTLQTLAHDDVFAAGDIAAVVGHPRPKAGVFAVRQGPPLTANLRARLLGEEPEPFHPQEKFLSLISTGDKYAVASRGEWAAGGAWVWRWKDSIDRRFMERFNDLPEMAALGDDEAVDPRLIDEDAARELVRGAAIDSSDLPPGLGDRERAYEVLSSAPERCGGCGAKVGASTLARVLRQLTPVRRADVVVGLDAADDAAVIEVAAGKQLAQTTDFFRVFLDDPFIFGQIAANHALGDLFAMAAEPHSALATVTVPYGLEAKVEADLVQLLAGALQVFNAHGVALIGGHSAEGGELAAGFTVNGLVDAGTAIGKGGLRLGDVLVLTKPLGTGALFAADMRGKAKGRWIEGAVRSMTLSSREAADCLVAHGVSAMTDVTGFGLLGHLVEMLDASRVGARLELEAIPILDGVVEVTRVGMFSSLQSVNLRLGHAIDGDEGAAAHPVYPLLFDPQTAGGLLAGVAADRVKECVDELRDRGYGRAVAIGEIRDAGDGAAAVRVST